MKKIIKSLLVTTLTTALILGSGFSAFATPTVTSTSPQVNLAATPVTLPILQDLRAEAVVKSTYSEGRLLVAIEGSEYIFNISENTIIIDAKTGLPGNLKDLKVGDKINAHYSAAMTKSIPPQTSASVIVVNLQEGKSSPHYFEVKEIVSKNANEIRVLNREGDLIVTITKEIAITPFKTKQIVRMDDIKVGSKIFVWYEIVAMSYPGQTGAQKVVFVGQGPEYQLVINGKNIDLSKDKTPGAKGLIEENGQVLVPLRTVANALGFKLHWDFKTRTISMDDGQVKTVLTLGTDSYYKASSKAIGLTQSLPLGAAPIIVKNTPVYGSVYVPASLFKLLYSDENAVKIAQTE